MAKKSYPWLKPGIWGAIIGAIVIMVVGFWQFGWVLGSKADQMARDRASTAVAEALSAALAGRSTAEATHALQEAGVGAHEVLTTEQVMTSEPARKLGLSLTQRSEEFGPVVMPGLTVRLSESPLVLGRPAGRAGSDAESILAEVGLAGRMTELSRSWVLRTDNLPPPW